MGSGNRAANQRAKNAATAAYMKARGITRKTGRCAICYRIVALDKMHQHVSVGCK